MAGLRTSEARTLRVRSINKIEARIDLGFGVSVDRVLLLQGVHPTPLTPKMQAEAKHCLVVLLGGKRLIVQTARTVDAQGGPVEARVFLREKIYGRPVGKTEDLPEARGRPVLEVGPFLTWLLAQGLDISLVRRVVNGGPPDGDA